MLFRSQLREAQESNRRLMEAQRELEARNRHLSSLFGLSQALVGEHDPQRILHQVLSQTQRELGLRRLSAYLVHESGGYLIGLGGEGEGFAPMPILQADHPLVLRIQALPLDQVICSPELHNSPFWEAGQELGWWSHRDQGLLLPLGGRTGETGLWGLLAAGREGEPFLPHEKELVGLNGGMLQVSVANATLISTLNQAHQALAESYERVETSLGELQRVQTAAGQRSRNLAVGDLLTALAPRLLADLDHLTSSGSEEALRAASLIKAVLRRGGQVGSAMPERVDLHALISQELEILRILGTLPASLEVHLELRAPQATLYAVPSDFTEVLNYLLQNALTGLPPARHVRIRTEGDDAVLRLSFTDDGPPIPASLIPGAFEPFAGLSGELDGARHPTAGLAACAQLMAAYRGEPTLESRAGHTVVTLTLPLEA